MQKTFVQKYGYLKYMFYVLPGLIGLYIFAVYPNLQVFPLSFYKWNGVSKTKTFVGWQNISTTFNSPYFKQSLLNTISYILFLFVVQSIVALLLALILKKNTVHNKFFRTLFFFPLVLSTVMVGLTWGYMYDPNIGLINQILTKIGFSNFSSFAWVTDAHPIRATFFIVVIHIWHNIGYPITLLTAGLLTIPNDLYEAADIEGATARQVFTSVTMPLLLPTFSRITLLTVATGAMAFDYVFLMGSSALIAAKYDTLAVGIYKDLAGTNLGMSASKGVMLGVILFVVFMVQYVVTKKIENSIS